MGESLPDGGASFTITIPSLVANFKRKETSCMSETAKKGFKTIYTILEKGFKISTLYYMLLPYLIIKNMIFGINSADYETGFSAWKSGNGLDSIPLTMEYFASKTASEYWFIMIYQSIFVSISIIKGFVGWMLGIIHKGNEY